MSLEGLAALLAAASGLLLWALAACRRLRVKLAALDESVRHAEAAGREQARRLAALQSLQDAQQLTEHAIATGTAVVREVHRGIADIPFSVLEAIPAARAPAKALRGLHDAISDGVYSALGNLNKAVGRELRKGAGVEVGAAETTAEAAPDTATGAEATTEPSPPPAPPAGDPAPEPPPKRGWG